MFDYVFADARCNKASHDMLRTARATEVNTLIRRDNPTMLAYNPNLVDFSNPESVVQMQSPVLNPFGTYNPNANPNIRPPTIQTPVQQPMYTNYTNTGYRVGYSMDNLSAADTAQFMIPDPHNKRIPIGKYGKPTPPKPSKYDGLTYSERKLLPIPVAVSKIRVHKPVRQRQIRIEYKKTEYIPNVPYTNEELNPANRVVKFFVETPLDWSKEDAQDVINILDQIYTYDIALTIGVGEMVAKRQTSGFNEYSREKYERMMQYLQNKLDEYKRNEQKFKNIIDYRAPYRYRTLPLYYLDNDGNYLFPIQEEPIAKIRKDKETGEKIYQYDRGRDWLTVEEWELFKGRALYEMKKGIDKIAALEFAELNKHLTTPSIQKQPEPDLPEYNPYDSISVKLHRMKAAEKEYNIHKNFFRFILRHNMTDTEFDNWWYGTSTKPQNQTTVQANPKELWARDMHAKHLQFLHSLQPVNYAQQGALCRQMMIKRLREYDKGLEKPDLSLPECMALLGYLGIVRPSEINIERQQRERAELKRQNMSRNVFMQNMYHNVNNLARNPNPQYVPKYGIIDPRYNMPSHYVDLTQNEESQHHARIVYEAAANMGRHPRLHTLYK